jgi:hypothetical protein
MVSTEFILYQTEDGQTRIEVRMVGEMVWLNLNQISELFGRDKSVVSRHIRNVFDEGELRQDSVVANFATTAGDAKTYQGTHHNLDVIISVGYRVKSHRGTRFRIWATQRLREYLVKGFILDDARLKEPDGTDYFDELLRRIRDIRASEKRFYQKVRDLIALSVDYHDDPEADGLFFAEVQNKLLYAVTRQTTAEIVVARADPAQPNMALTTWKAGRVRKTDVIVAKNYLNTEEIDHLNRIVTLFLEFAELRTQQRKALRMEDWRSYVDSFLQFNESPLLSGSGSVSRDQMLQAAHERYEEFDTKRRSDEARLADAEDLKELRDVERLAAKRGGPDAS